MFNHIYHLKKLFIWKIWNGCTFIIVWNIKKENVVCYKFRAKTEFDIYVLKLIIAL